MYQRMKYFFAVANFMSFTAAAEHMYVSQQAITRQITLLEQELGVKLFHRTTRSVELTLAGKVCRDEFAKIDMEMANAINRTRNTATANTATITIGFYQFFSRTRIITPVMNALYKQFPEIHFRIRLYDFRDLRHNLLGGNLDLCFAVSSDWEYWTLVKIMKLYPINFKLVVSIEHPLAAYDVLPLEALSKYPWFTVKNLDILRPYPSFWSSNIPCKVKIPADNIMTALAYVEAGRGFTCQPPVFSGSDHSTLKLFPLPFEDAVLDFVCACRSDMMDAQVIQVVRFIQHNFPLILP